MTVLVTAASKHGATEEIAERIGAVLGAHGVEVDVKKLQDVGGLGGYQAVVLGSGQATLATSHSNPLPERPAATS